MRWCGVERSERYMYRDNKWSGKLNIPPAKLRSTTPSLNFFVSFSLRCTFLEGCAAYSQRL